ncbi:MAG TPA: Na/Pi symporter, partial [Chitinispirillaceae bacterium]|nr:Na/Pi symporter [Chitinispirillaceae bacterium]
MNISLFDLFYLLCGLAIFLYGMQQGEKILKRLGGSDLRRILKVITRHRLSAWFAGLVTTLITQSSSATTVVLVSLASARLMSFGQSLGMILGSDLGTTVTVQLFAFKFDQIAPLLIAAGFFISMRRSSEKVSGYGKLILALGFIFFGMSIMAEAVMPLRSYPAFESIMQASLNNQWYGLLAGTVIT